jgi:hypothetical protein
MARKGRRDVEVRNGVEKFDVGGSLTPKVLELRRKTHKFPVAAGAGC